MKKLLSISYSEWSFNLALFVLRVGVGILLLMHGYNKIEHFDTMKNTFLNFLGMGSTTSLILSIFAELFCSIFIILGLFTRLAAIPIIIDLTVALWKIHHFNFFGDGEKASLYLLAFIAILLVGPGKASVDGMRS
ncbi:MAG: DoxX family protein [Bacteroidetes bacterium]|nr:MAG: DoxX family protein [Bacteroidota bacterium]